MPQHKLLYTKYITKLRYGCIVKNII